MDLVFPNVFMENMYLLSDQDDQRDPSLLTSRVHPVEVK